MDSDQVLSFKHALAQLQGIRIELLNTELPEPGQDGEISDCVLAHINHASTFLSFNEQAFEEGHSFSEQVEDLAFRIVELYAQMGSVLGRKKKDRETINVPTRVEGVVPDAREDRTGSIAPFEAAPLDRAGSGSVAPFKTGSLDNVLDKTDTGKLKATSSANTLKTMRSGLKRQESDEENDPCCDACRVKLYRCFGRPGKSCRPCISSHCKCSLSSRAARDDDLNAPTKRQRPSPIPHVVSEDERAGEGEDVPASKKAKVMPKSKVTDNAGSELLRVEKCIKRALETQEGIRARLSRVWDHSVQLSRLYEKGFKETEELNNHIQVLRRALAENVDDFNAAPEHLKAAKHLFQVQVDTPEKARTTRRPGPENEMEERLAHRQAKEAVVLDHAKEGGASTTKDGGGEKSTVKGNAVDGEESKSRNDKENRRRLVGMRAKKVAAAKSLAVVMDVGGVVMTKDLRREGNTSPAGAAPVENPLATGLTRERPLEIGCEGGPVDLYEHSKRCRLTSEDRSSKEAADERTSKKHRAMAESFSDPPVVPSQLGKEKHTMEHVRSLQGNEGSVSLVPADVSASVEDKRITSLEGGYQAAEAMRIRMERELQLSHDREAVLEERIRNLEHRVEAQQRSLASASTQLPGRLESAEGDREVQEWKRLAHNYRVQLNEEQQYLTRLYMQLRHWESKYAPVPSAPAQQERMWEEWVGIRDDIFAQVLTFPPEPLRRCRNENLWLENDEERDVTEKQAAGGGM